MAYELYEHGFGEYISGFTGEALKIGDDGYCSYKESVDYDCDTIFYVPVSNFLHCFQMLTAAWMTSWKNLRIKSANICL